MYHQLFNNPPLNTPEYVDVVPVVDNNLGRGGSVIVACWSNNLRPKIDLRLNVRIISKLNNEGRFAFPINHRPPQGLQSQRAPTTTLTTHRNNNVLGDC